MEEVFFTGKLYSMQFLIAFCIYPGPTKPQNDCVNDIERTHFVYQNVTKSATMRCANCQLFFPSYTQSTYRHKTVPCQLCLAIVQ